MLLWFFFLASKIRTEERERRDEDSERIDEDRERRYRERKVRLAGPIQQSTWELKKEMKRLDSFFFFFLNSFLTYY